MAFSTNADFVHTYTNEKLQHRPEPLWDQKFIIDNLPPWIYERYEQPSTVSEAKAKISSLEHTIRDMDLQMEIRECDKSIAQQTYGSSFDVITWENKTRKILKAKQSTLYVLNAFKYFVLMSESDPLLTDRFNKLVNLLAEDPVDFTQRVKELLD